MSGKYIDMNGYSCFRILQYFCRMGWEKFMTLDINYICSRLFRLFFANVIINDDILEITSYDEGTMIVLNK